jgi:hypothetical protein
MAVSRNWHNLKTFLRKAYNREVNEWFKDLDSEAIPDNSTGRKNAKRACLVLANESQSMALMKMLAFRFTVQRVHLRPDIYGTPIGTLDAQRKYRPQVVLEFAEDEMAVEAGYARVDGKISFRLMDETSTTLSNTELTIMATKIKTEFGGVNGLVWKKGKDLASYTHKSKGYQFQLLVKSKEDAKDLITKVLAISSDTPDWSKLSYKEADDATTAYPTIPGTAVILTKTCKKPRIRPIANVRFQYAYCSVWGKPNPVILYDRSLRYLNALVKL